MILMKKLPLYLFLVLMFSLFTSHSFAEKYAVENPDRFANEKHQELDCNLSIRDWSICDAYGYTSMFCYGKDGKKLSESERKKYDNKNPYTSRIKYSGKVNKNNNIDTDWYLSDAWGIRHARGIEKKYKHGKSLGVCIKKDGAGFYYTAVKSFSSKAGKKQSWVNITSLIGQQAWSGSEGNNYGKSNKDFPISIGEIKKFQLAYDYNFKSKGTYNNNITFWLRHPNDFQPFIEIMLKFDANARKHAKKKLKNLKTDNYEFNVYSSKGMEFKRAHEGLDYFFSISAFEKNTKITKDGNYFVDINLKQVFDYLLEKKLVKSTDIVPGIEVTTEIWDGIGEMKIKKLKYEINKE